MNGTSLVVKGNLQSDEDVTIDGRVEGRIELKDSVLTVGPTGRITADVVARSVVVRGAVVGNITALENVAILDTGFIDGDIAARRVTIAESAHFRGRVQMPQPA